jgi:tetratricopeptide (TPR) repeat protein
MLGFGWLPLRQAQEALKNGRLEEAQRLLSQSAVQGRRGAGELVVRLAQAYTERGGRHLDHDDAEAAWRDLLQAETLQTAEKSCVRLRAALTRLGVAEVRGLLQAGEIGRGEEVVARLRQRSVRSPELRILEEALGAWLKVRSLSEEGELARALDEADRVRRLLGPNKILEEQRRDLEEKLASFTELVPRLHKSIEAERWPEVLEVAEQVLRAAPNHAEARKARARAWKAVEPVTVSMHVPAPDQEQEAVCEGVPSRFLLWIDGVGGYLVCLGGRLTFGQATPDARVDVPLVADVSRLHATLSRDLEGYLLEAVRPIQVNGQTTSRALLRPGDRVTLGASCQFQIHQPVPISASARLDLVSGHRVPLGVDAVLLMADTLVLANDPQAHVTVPDLKKPVILFRHKDGLGIRHSGHLAINGRKSSERGLLGSRATVIADEASFAIEPVNG